MSSWTVGVVVPAIFDPWGSPAHGQHLEISPAWKHPGRALRFPHRFMRAALFARNKLSGKTEKVSPFNVHGYQRMGEFLAMVCFCSSSTVFSSSPVFSSSHRFVGSGNTLLKASTSDVVLCGPFSFYVVRLGRPIPRGSFQPDISLIDAESQTA